MIIIKENQIYDISININKSRRYNIFIMVSDLNRLSQFFSFIVDFLPWPILMVKIFAVVSLAIVDEAAFLGLVATILDIVTIVIEPIIHLILVGLSMVCLKALTYTLKSTLLLWSPMLMLVWLIFVPGRMTKLKLSLVSLESSMKLFLPWFSSLPMILLPQLLLFINVLPNP